MLDETLHPVEAHVKCFGSFSAHVDSEDYLGGCVVSLDRSGQLRMTNFNQVCADRHSLLAIDEYHTGFNHGSEMWHLARNGPIWFLVGRMGGGGGVDQIVIARSTTAWFGLNKIRCVTFNVETHVVSVKMDDDVWLCGIIVNQQFRLLDGVGGGKILFGDDFVERDEHVGIDGA